MRLLPFLLIFLPFLYVFSQITATINGVIKDSDQQPLEFVSVYITKAADASQLIASTTTDPYEAFTLENISYDSYERKARFLEFQTLSKKAGTLSRQLNFNLIAPPKSTHGPFY